MTKDEVKVLLGNRRNNFYHVVNGLVKYVNVYENKVNIINEIVLKAKANKGFTSVDLYKFFYEALKDLVEGTVYCKSKYNAQMLLKSVWETARFQNIVVTQIRNKYAIVRLPQKEEQAESGKDPETERQKQLRKQAEVMRAAKARKALNKKVLDDFKKQNKEKTQVAKQLEKKTESKLSKEYEAKINLLKNLKV
jgi:hypothetical protein